MIKVLFLVAAFTIQQSLQLTLSKNFYEVVQNYQAQNSKQLTDMVSTIRRNGDDNKTWILAYGDSITDGFGASNMEKIGYTNLLREGLQLLSSSFDHPIDPKWQFDLVKNSAGWRCVNKKCDRPLEKDKWSQVALKYNVSAVILFVGTNDCKNYQWNEQFFKNDYMDLIKTFQNMTSKPDIFPVIPPPIYKDGFSKINQSLANTALPRLIPELAKQSGIPAGNIINLFDAMGGSEMSRPDFYCSGRHCDGFHPIDAGQYQIASTILPKIIDFYMKNPKGQGVQPAIKSTMDKLRGGKVQLKSSPVANEKIQKKDGKKKAKAE